MAFFDNHTHTHFSNIRLLDCINRPKDIVNKAIELGLSGVAITDHETLSSHIEVNKLAKEYREKYPDFTIALGNEIYLTDDRSNGQKYYHFILIAKDAAGHRLLRELSSKAWMNSYYDRGMERVPTLKSELEKIVMANPGHLIATTACIGGELGTSILRLEECEAVGDNINGDRYYQQIINFVEFCKRIFNDDFYLEVAPGKSKDQVRVNHRINKISQAFGVKICSGSDAHYLTKEDRYVHKAYLNSKGGEREVDSFYEYTYLMNEEEIRANLQASFNDAEIDKIFNNSIEIKNKIEFFDLTRNQTITEIPVKNYEKTKVTVENCPTLTEMLMSDNIQERYWVNECFNALEKKFGQPPQNYVERLEEEAVTKKIIGEKLGTCMFAYPNTLQHYINLFWECGSMVGAGRGSSCSGLNHYLLGITQLDPIKWDLPWFRYMNSERVELGDIDLDLCPSKRPAIIQAIKDEREQFFNPSVDEYSRKNLGCTLVATFGTETTKSAIQTACRGYRSEDYPEGIDVDEAQYLSSLVPVERGFLWPIHDVVYGNPETDRKPVVSFISYIKQYPGLLDIIVRIEGLINKRSSHASGVIFFDNDPFELGCFMKTPKGEIITQYDLHMAEAAGMTKYDFLVTEVQDKLVQTIDLMQNDGVIEPELTLREVYDKYFNPEILPLDNEDIWKALQTNGVINTFQFDSDVGSRAAKKILPKSIQEMTDANGLMRLMTGGKGEENPIDKYIRFKNNLNLWYEEMEHAGLTKEEQTALEPYFKPSYGVPPSQEQLMLMLMDKNICGFTLAEANSARKVVGKKQMSKIPELQQKVLTSAKSKALGEYVWRCGVGPQMGYSFSKIHALAYSMIGVQTLYIATHWNPIYWNTACLIVNSGALETDSDKIASTDYSKVAKAIGDIQSAGINISLVDINHSDFGFKPDVQNNQILYGLKSLSNVGDDVIRAIIDNRPYVSLLDFCSRVPVNKQAMISLIKGGAFDQFNKRERVMVEYIWLTCDKKKRLTLQNLGGLIRHGLIPEETEEQVTARRIYEFNRFLKSECLTSDKRYYQLNERAIDFISEMGYDDRIEYNALGAVMQPSVWDKAYQGWMDVFRRWIEQNREQTLKALNTSIFMEDWNKYAAGNISAWEMDALCFYYHDHELKNINRRKYGLSNFKELPEEPVVEYTSNRGYAVFKLNAICGTCIAKNKAKSTVYLLTTDGVVPIKFTKDYFAMFDRQIKLDGKIAEKSWFNRGSMIVVQGMRRGDEFVAKSYAKSALHQLYKIDEVFENGDVSLRHDRISGEETDEEI